MHRVGQIVKLLGLSLLGGLLILLRYILRTPQPLESALSGEDHIYKWTQGHIFYKVLGALDAPPLVLLHTPEIGASAYEMRHIITGLAQRYRVYAPDLLGFGLSDHPDINYSADVYVALYRDFLRDVVKQSAVLLASGLSCNYAVAVASGAPDLCQRLLFLSPVSLFKQSRSYPWLARLARTALLGTFIYSLLTPRFILRRVIGWQHALDVKHFSDNDFNYYFAAAHQLGAQYAALAFIAGKLSLDVSLQFENLQQPTLIIWGIHALHHIQSVMKQYIVSPQMQTIFLRNAGLHVHEEASQQVIANILQWQEAPARENAIVSAQPIFIEPTEAVTIDSTSIAPSPGVIRSERTHETVGTVQNSQPITNSEPGVGTPAVSEDVKDGETVEAYCVKCKQKRRMQGARRIVTKNGRSAMEGTCPVCSTKLFRFISG